MKTWLRDKSILLLQVVVTTVFCLFVIIIMIGKLFPWGYLVKWSKEEGKHK